MPSKCFKRHQDLVAFFSLLINYLRLKCKAKGCS